LNRTKCEVELALDEFALEEVERVAGRLGVPRARVVQRAVRHWLDEQSSGRLAAQPLAGGPPPGPHPAVPLAVDLPPSDWEALRQAARTNHMEPERLVGQAVLLLLADVHSGRIAAGVARSTNGMGPEPPVGG
jgi:hypothetical protein